MSEWRKTHPSSITMVKTEYEKCVYCDRHDVTVYRTPITEKKPYEKGFKSLLPDFITGQRTVVVEFYKQRVCENCGGAYEKWIEPDDKNLELPSICHFPRERAIEVFGEPTVVRVDKDVDLKNLNKKLKRGT